MSMNIFLEIDGKKIPLRQTETELTKELFKNTSGLIEDKEQAKKVLEHYFKHYKKEVLYRADKIEFNKQKVKILNALNICKYIKLFMN